MLSNASGVAPRYPRSRGMLTKLSTYEQNTSIDRGSGKISPPGDQAPLFHIFAALNPQIFPTANGARGA